MKGSTKMTSLMGKGSTFWLIRTNTLANGKMDSLMARGPKQLLLKLLKLAVLRSQLTKECGKLDVLMAKVFASTLMEANMTVLGPKGIHMDKVRNTMWMDRLTMGLGKRVLQKVRALKN